MTPADSARKQQVAAYWSAALLAAQSATTVWSRLLADQSFATLYMAGSIAIAIVMVGGLVHWPVRARMPVWLFLIGLSALQLRNLVVHSSPDLADGVVGALVLCAGHGALLLGTPSKRRLVVALTTLSAFFALTVAGLDWPGSVPSQACLNDIRDLDAVLVASANVPRITDPVAASLPRNARGEPVRERAPLLEVADDRITLDGRVLRADAAMTVPRLLQEDLNTLRRNWPDRHPGRSGQEMVLHVAMPATTALDDAVPLLEAAAPSTIWLLLSSDEVRRIIAPQSVAATVAELDALQHDPSRHVSRLAEEIAQRARHCVPLMRSMAGWTNRPADDRTSDAYRLMIRESLVACRCKDVDVPALGHLLLIASGADMTPPYGVPLRLELGLDRSSPTTVRLPRTGTLQDLVDRLPSRAPSDAVSIELE